MALRAGYYGLKNSVKRTLEKLAADMAGAKIIKTIGTGLTLSNAGKLDVEAATDTKLGGIIVGTGLSASEGTLNVTQASADSLGGIKVGDNLSIDENGVLSASGGSSTSYSTTEYDTGKVWINGKHIYGKYYDFSNNKVTLSGQGTEIVSKISNMSDIDQPIEGRIFRDPADSSGSACGDLSIAKMSNHFTVYCAAGFSNCTGMYLEYTKNVSQS